MPVARASLTKSHNQKVVSCIALKLHFAWHPSCASAHGYDRASPARACPPTRRTGLHKEERMAGAPQEKPTMKPTLGLTGVTVNAMALIAPGAFLWITFVLQAGYVFPSGLSMWAGIFVALMLAYATALSYSELAKLYPGAGSSYLFAEQAFLNTTHAYRFSRIAKFVIGWASHLYYWVYPGVMVATMGVMIGYIFGNIMPGVINPAVPGPVFMALIAIIFAYLVAWIAYKGVNGSTNVNLVINIIQICALLFFSALAIAYRLGHPDGSMGLALDGTSKVIHFSFTAAAT